MEISRFEAFSEFQITNFLTDIEIILFNGTIKAHRLVLAASSEFFKVLLNNDVCKEVSTGIINLPSVDFDVFNYIFDHIYLRNSEKNSLNKDLSFYIDVIEACDYLRMVDLIDLLDTKISMKFSHFELFKDFERISSLPMIKTKLKIQDQITILINSRQYSDLFDVSMLNFVKILDENLTINENVLWEFLGIYFERILSISNDRNSKQQLIDSIRPSLLNNRNFESFYRFLTNHNFQWRNRSENDLRTIISCLPDEKIREMNFQSSISIDKCRSIPCLLIVGSGNYNRNLSVSTIPILRDVRNCWENSLTIDICPDNFRCHSFRNHLVVLNKNWDLNSNFGVIFNVADFKSLTIPNWDFSAVDYNRFWGFSVCLVELDLYLFGGCYFTHASVTVPSNSIIKFNFVSSQWEICQRIRLKSPCWSSCVVSDINRIVYVAGGRSPQKYLKTFYAIDLDRNTIIDYPSMPFTVSGHSMEIAGNLIGIFGGAWDSCIRHEILMFDLLSSIWRVVSLRDIPGSCHVDYCCLTTDRFISDCKFVLYDLRIDSENKLKIYTHEIDDLTAEHNNRSSKPIEMEIPVGFCPKSISYGMTMKSTDSATVRIQKSLFGNSS